MSLRSFAPIVLVAAACWIAGCQKSAPAKLAITSQDSSALQTVPTEKPKNVSAASEPRTLPAATAKKLDPQLLLALKQSRAEPPFDNPHTPPPDLPYRMGDRVLVDLSCVASDDLLKHIASLDGRVADTPKSPQLIRVMIPINQLEAVAGHADVRSIAPAEVFVNSKATTTVPEPGISKP